MLVRINLSEIHSENRSRMDAFIAYMIADTDLRDYKINSLLTDQEALLYCIL